MTSFNFRSFFNFLNRNKLYSVINVFGFALSLMFVILLTTYAQKEARVDDFQENKDRLFLFANEKDASYAYPVGQWLKDRYPEIESYTYLTNNFEQTEINGNETGASILKVDSSFFNIFSYRLTEGSREQALTSVNNVAVSEEFARRVFGEKSPIGQTITYAGNPMTVSAVFASFGNSTIQNPDLIMRIELFSEEHLKTTNYNGWELWILARENTDLTQKIPDMLEFLKERYWMYNTKLRTEVKLLPIKEAYFTNISGGNGFRNFGDRKQFILLSSIGLLILIFAVINYINLSVAQSGLRAKEMAMRRLLGGTRRQLFRSLIFESILLCAISFIVGIFFASAAEPVFNRLIGTGISIEESFSGINVLYALLMIVLLGIVTGAVPASVISNYQPIEVVRGTFRRKTKMVYSRILITFQYLITIVLIGCTITMIRQVEHLVTADMGYKTEQLYIMTNEGLSSTASRAFQNDISQIQGVEMVSLCQGTPLDGGNNNTDPASFPGNAISYQIFKGDSLYFKIMDFEILRDNHIPDPDARWLNEAALRALDLDENASEFLFYTRPTKIAGIVKDFYFHDLTQPCGPAQIINTFSKNDRPRSILVKISGNDLPGTLQKIEKVYKDLSGRSEMNGQFAEQIIQQWYTSQQNLSRIIGYLAVIAALIATLGILAMSTYFIRQRSMEIAIRKVYGSTNREILKRLIANFLKLVIAAFVIAAPVIRYLMHRWLSDYPYRISLDWTIFAVAGITTLAIAFLTIFWQSSKASNANTVDTIQK